MLDLQLTTTGRLIQQGQLRVSSGVSITTGGLTIVGNALITGAASIGFGALSVTSSDTSASALLVYASNAAYSGNVIAGRTAAGEVSGNLLSLVTGSALKFQVRDWA